jgi:S-adenosylmethionine synthetase
MPMPIQLAHQVARRLAEVRKSGQLPFLRPDGKSQVTVEYDADGRPVRVATVLVSTQHDPEVAAGDLSEAVRELVIRAAIPHELLDERTRYLVNPTGRFVIGGPMGDSGLSGRKIIVDTYGGMARHGGGSFSARTRPRSTVPARTWLATWRRTSSPQGWRDGSSSSWPTRSASRVRWR